VERNDIEKALKTALKLLRQAVEDSDAAGLKMRQAASEADRALTRVETAERLIQDIQRAIGETPKEKGNEK